MSLRLLSSLLCLLVAFSMIGPQPVEAQLFQRLANQRNASGNQRPTMPPYYQRQAVPQPGYRYGQPNYRSQAAQQPRGLFRNLSRQPSTSRQRQPNSLRSLFSGNTQRQQPNAGARTPTPRSQSESEKSKGEKASAKGTGPQVPNTNLTRNEYAQIVYGGAGRKNTVTRQQQRLKKPTDGRIHVHLPASAKSGLAYTIDGKPSRLQPGKSFSLDGRRSWVIGFKPSPTALAKKYTLSKVTNYQFEQIQSGWELIEVDYDAQPIKEALAAAKESQPSQSTQTVAQSVAQPAEDTSTDEEFSILDDIVNEVVEEQTETSAGGGN